jgi:ABC-type multidrug transport system fused ATPase/permease subunit
MLLLFYNYLPLNRLIQRVATLEDIDLSLVKIQ